MVLRGALRGAAFTAALLGASAAWAQGDCPRGDLDQRFCDRDGDMVADIPTDAKQQVNPSTLIFAYTPVEDPEVYRKVYDGFLAHLAQVTGKKVQFFPVQSNAAQIEAMRAGRLHVAGYNTGATPLAVNCAGFRPFSMMASKDGRFGYQMEIIVQADGPIQSPADIKGRTMAFSAPTSNSGFKAPSVLLRSEFGLEVDKDYKAAFSGKHDNTILGVANKDYDAGSIASGVLYRMVGRNVVDPKKLRSLYKSDFFPTTAYGVAHNLQPELQKKIEEAFFSFKWDGTELLKEYSKSDPPQESFIPVSYQKAWDIVRKIDKASGVSYACK
jgi:phosphonate transport system substrate-binding protein